MPSFEEHVAECRRILGHGFPDVHRWLDEFFGKPPWGIHHRHLRHHQEGVEAVRRTCGDLAARAAEIHIRQDLEAEGWPKDKTLPKNSGEYLERIKGGGLLVVSVE